MNDTDDYENPQGDVAALPELADALKRENARTHHALQPEEPHDR
jgi:hypothetical protein